MSSIAEVKRLAEAEAKAKDDLKRGIAAAVEAGIPKTKLARAAGISRSTVDLWISEIANEQAGN